MLALASIASLSVLLGFNLDSQHDYSGICNHELYHLFSNQTTEQDHDFLNKTYGTSSYPNYSECRDFMESGMVNGTYGNIRISVSGSCPKRVLVMNNIKDCWGWAEKPNNAYIVRGE